MTPSPKPTSSPAARPGGAQLAWITAVLTVAAVFTQTHITLVLWALDGVLALGVVVAATLAGFGVLAAFRLGALPAAWRWTLAAGLGVGLLALLVLACGLARWIGVGHRWVAPLGLGLFALVGFAFYWRGRSSATSMAPNAGRLRWLAPAMAPFAALAMLVATLPPGVLWVEEGRGYDVLEYHLQLPREYFEAGAIEYLPHNVYANFPSSAEMLYLFCTIVTGDPIESWSTCQCFNALLAALVVVAAWLLGRELSPHGGVVTAVLTASVGWLVYLSGVAYVENGLLFMGMLSAACVVRGAREDVAPAYRTRWMALAGVLAGLSCGFKYTGVVMVALPIGVMLVVLVREPMGRRVKSAGLFSLAAVAAFCPWLMKNLAMTGNPVFPLFSERFSFQPAGWGAAEAEHFAAAHAPGPEEAAVAARLALAWRHIVADPPQRFGPIVLVLAMVGLLRRRGRLEWAAAAALGVQLLVWLFATHLYARFTVPMLIPLVLLAGRAVADRDGLARGGWVALLLAGVAFNGFKTAELYAAHTRVEGERVTLEGATFAFTEGLIASHRHLATINRKLPEDARVYLVGDARPFYFQRDTGYCVVFNRKPLVEYVKTRGVERTADWLREAGYTHVFVHWGEIQRLRRSRYGFPKIVTPAMFGHLRLMEQFAYEEGAAPYGALYEVP